ncbi:MAG TPA: CBS domain-containing protein [Labilithrix sp.]|nr:CBS domain-containing protein [Labilithrix sp.]
MQVRTPMTRNVIVVPPALSVGDAWGILQRENIRHLPVVSHSKIVGMISDRDLLRVGDFLPTRELAFWEQSVGEVMSKTPIVCSPSATVAAAARLMTEKKIDALPVVSGQQLVGLVTSTDLLLLLADWAPEHALPFDFRVLEATFAA